LGNSLFQCAATISLALDNNDSYGFPKWEYAPHFNLDFCFFDNINVVNSFQEPGFAYTKIPYKNNLDLKGFFQSEKYFINHKDMILDLLTPKYEVSPEDGFCGIHVRRGDYINLKDCYAQLGMDYYSMAMGKVKANRYVIFSDDIGWCKRNFIGNQFEFSENKQPHEDLAIMAKRCSSIIMANSSFSWWGAYLNKNPDKVIIAPNKWFGPKLPHDTKDLIPNEWVRI
jgi:hypothetical protein